MAKESSKILNKKSVVVMLVSLVLMGCGSKTMTRSEWRPYSGVTPSVGSEYAVALCKTEGQQASDDAFDNFEKIDIVTTSASAAMWSGIRYSQKRRDRSNDAYETTFKGCMTKTGYKLIKYKVQK